MEVFDQSPPTPEELSFLPKLRDLIGHDLLLQAPPEVASNFGLVRFLRGYLHDLDETAKAFKLGMDWRISKSAHTFRDSLKLKENETTTLKEIVAHYTNRNRLPFWDRIACVYPERCFCGQDLDGNPVMMTRHDMIDNIFGLLTVVSKEEFESYRIARLINMELYLDALSRHTNKLVKCVFVWDLQGMTRSVLQQWEHKQVKIFDGEFDSKASVAFPEQAHRIIALNVPSWLILLWNMAKRVVPRRTMQKIHVTSSDQIPKDCRVQMEMLDFKTFVVPRQIGVNSNFVLPNHATKALEFESASSSMITYWSIRVSSGGVWVKMNSKEEAFFVSEFYRGTFHGKLKESISVECRGSLFDFLGRTIDFISFSFDSRSEVEEELSFS